MAEQDILALMQAQPGMDNSTPVAPDTMTPPPMPSPMSTPEPKAGNREAAMINVSMAMDLIEQSLPAIGSETSEGASLMQALSKLSTVLGPKKQKTGELQRAEILQLLQNLPQAGGGTPLSQAIGQSPPNLGLMGAPAPAPAGAPPAMPPGMPPGGPIPAPM